MELAEVLGVPNLSERLDEVEDRLTRTIQERAPRLAASCLRQVRGGGKRIRPALVIAAAEMLGGDPASESVIAGAAAVELVHVGSLVHDDIIDRADARRGVPTINADGQEGTEIALLAGDYLLALAGEAAASVSREVASVLARTIVSLCDGQVEELASNFDTERTEQSALRSIGGKTAALLQASCEIGALCAGAPIDQVEALAAFGWEFGISFQVVDDILDVASTEGLLGKPVGNDIRTGVYTLPVLYALEEDDGTLRSLLRKREGGVHSEEVTAEALELVRGGSSLQRAADRASGHARSAVDALMALRESAGRTGLMRLPEHYVADTLDHKAPMWTSR